MQNILKVLAKLDDLGLTAEVDILDNHIRKNAKKDVHKCGLKETTIEAHNALLEDYRKALEKLQKEKKSALLSSNEVDSPNYGKLRDTCRDIIHNENAIYLHEMFIADTVDNQKPFELSKTTSLSDMLKDLYTGGEKNLMRDLERMVKLPRNGWVLLNFCTKTKALYIDIIDLHEIGISAFSIPVAAIDLWEHSYYGDFGTDREAYYQWWNGRMDWRNVEKRIRNLMRLKEI